MIALFAFNDFPCNRLQVAGLLGNRRPEITDHRRAAEPQADGNGLLPARMKCIGIDPAGKRFR